MRRAVGKRIVPPVNGRSRKASGLFPWNTSSASSLPPPEKAVGLWAAMFSVQPRTVKEAENTLVVTPSTLLV